MTTGGRKRVRDLRTVFDFIIERLEIFMTDICVKSSTDIPSCEGFVKDF